MMKKSEFDESVAGAAPVASGLPPDDALFSRVSAILDQAHKNVVRAVNHNMVTAYWLIGREIVIELQRGEARAGYGEEVLKELAARLTPLFGAGYSQTNLRNFRFFYLAYCDADGQIQHTVCAESGDGHKKFNEDRGLVPVFSSQLSWSHYRALMRIQNRAARTFYEIESDKGGWSVRELERQIHTQYYERLVATQIQASAPSTSVVQNSIDPLKDPYVLEFLQIPDPASSHEKGLEGAIIGHLRDFLLELGRGFAFVARQKRLSFDGDDLYVDLVFYNCILKCYLLIDLKMGRLTAADVGQMDSYVRMFDDLVAASDDNPTIGLILCTERNNAVARYSVLNDRRQIFASRYMTCLPSEVELVAEVQRGRALLDAGAEGDQPG